MSTAERGAGRAGVAVRREWDGGYAAKPQAWRDAGRQVRKKWFGSDSGGF
jgi:hypothetical protein